MPDVRERIYFDGWELTEGSVRNWEVRDGTDEVAGMVGDNLTVANRSGEVWRPKTLGAGRFQLQVWLWGTTKQAAHDQFRNLLRAVYRPHRLVRVTRTLASGEDVFCDAEVVGQIAPTHLGQNAYRATITFGVPAGVWFSSAVYTMTSAVGSALPKTLSLTEVAASTAPLECLTYTVYGPITNAKIIDNTDGGYADTLLYKGSIAAGAWISFNADTWAIQTGGFSYANNNVVPTGRRLMTVTAARPGDVPSVRLEGTGGGTATKLVVAGRCAYLC